ncbi:MAG: LamG domain-containing protein, partial [Muribaculaceae bacterium]|nr:LamG domain-containing protein [Muribaculaceae bacterium]
MKKFKTISLLAMGAAALSVYAADFLYFHRNGEVVQIIPAENTDRIVKGVGNMLDAVDGDGNVVYSFSPDEVDAITFSAPMPKADLLDVVFNADGTAEDVSPMKFDVERGGNATTEWSDKYNRYVARLTDNEWGNGDVAKDFYRIDYSSNQAFKDALADGHTLEVMFMPEYTSLPDGEAKVFASHEAGGTGIMFKASWSGPNNLNSLTFLPNVSTGTGSSWQWAASDVVPESNSYYHVVGVWDKEAKKANIYINGVLKNEIDIAGSNFIQAKDGANFFCIGGDACVPGGNKTTGVQNGINGRIVLARICDDALTSEQAELLYKAVDITKPAPMPKADLLDVVFKADGTAEDISPMKFEVERGGNATTEWSDLFNRYVTRLTDNKWGNSDVAEQFYRIDYSNNQAFKDALADGHTLEVMFMPEYTGNIPNVEAKIFASHEAGGTGIMIKGSWSGPNSLNSLTFLPNVSTGTGSSWQWAASDVVPEPHAYYHIVGVWDKDANKAKIYVNGVLKNEIDIAGSNFIHAKDGANFFCIGGDACVPGGNKTTGVQNGINGRIVLARIYDDALTSEQAQLLYKDVEEGVSETHPVIENVTLLENVQVKAGAIYPIYGTGFEDGDVIVIEGGSNRWELPAIMTGGESVNVVLPEDVKSGTFNVLLKRGERVQVIGTVDFLRVKKFESRAQIIAHRGYLAKDGAA